MVWLGDTKLKKCAHIPNQTKKTQIKITFTVTKSGLMRIDATKTLRLVVLRVERKDKRDHNFEYNPH